MFANNKGSAVVETALILPLLLLICFAICDFGWLIYVNSTLAHAAREGARFASVTPQPIRVDARVKQCITFRYDESDLTITTTPTPASGVPEKITVAVALVFHPFTPLFSALEGRILRGEVTMRYEL